MHRGKMRTLALAILIACQSTAAAQEPRTPMQKGQAPKNYASPSAVFEAYRAAWAKGDVRALLSCLTPENREGEVYQAFLGCHFRIEKPEVVAVLKEFGVEDSVVDAEYYRRYQAKHGVDVKKLQDDYQAKMGQTLQEYNRRNAIKEPSHAVPDEVMRAVGPPPSQDQALYRKVVEEKVVDKVGFVVAVQDALRDPAKPPDPLEPLTNVRVQGDTAVGQSTLTTYVETALPGEPPKRIPHKIEHTYRFRKTNNGWLISGVGYDFPTPPAARPRAGY